MQSRIDENMEVERWMAADRFHRSRSAVLLFLLLLRGDLVAAHSVQA